MKKPLDPNAAILQIAIAADVVAANVAGIMAYVASLPGADKVDIKAAKALAKQFAPTPLGPPGHNSPPDLIAQDAVARIHSIAIEFMTIRSAGSRKDAQP